MHQSEKEGKVTASHSEYSNCQNVMVIDIIVVLLFLIELMSNHTFLIFRYRIADLLARPFFQEMSGVRVEEVEDDENEHPNSNTIKLRLHVRDPKKRKDKHKDNEAIQFEFHLDNDQPEKVAQEMVSSLCVYLRGLYPTNNVTLLC